LRYSAGAATRPVSRGLLPAVLPEQYGIENSKNEIRSLEFKSQRAQKTPGHSGGFITIGH
jgi:hypothetical protein